jgi:hypothetical protein
VDLGEQGFWVGKVMQVLPRDPSLADAQTLQNQYAQAAAAAQMDAYLAALKARHKARIKPAAAALAGSAPER